MILKGLAEQLMATPAVAKALAPAASNFGSSVFAVVAIKGAVRPYVVVNLVDGPPAGSTLDGVSELIDGELQFTTFADDPIVGRTTGRLVRDTLKNYSGALPDGTTIQFVDVTMDLDDAYEQGGGGYIYSTTIRLAAFYTEAA